jgi:hypothetical protein
MSSRVSFGENTADRFISSLHRRIDQLQNLIVIIVTVTVTVTVTGDGTATVTVTVTETLLVLLVWVWLSSPRVAVAGRVAEA